MAVELIERIQLAQRVAEDELRAQCALRGELVTENALHWARVNAGEQVVVDSLAELGMRLESGKKKAPQGDLGRDEST
jgi:hypothetical protein